MFRTSARPALSSRGSSRYFEKVRGLGKSQIVPSIAFNVAIAVEHMVLRALDFGLGTCWVRLLDEQGIRELFGWSDEIHVVALLPVGFPAESPKARRRMSLQDLLLE